VSDKDSRVLLSIVVPTYNERENIGELLKRIDKALSAENIVYEVIIVDDNSPDGTADYAEELSRIYPVRVLRRPGKLGLSSAVMDGVRLSKGSIVAVMDADLQHPPEVLPKMLKILVSNGCDLVIASRYVKGGSVGSWSLLRKVISKGAILIARILLPKVRNVKDPMSGYFMFRREVIAPCIERMNPRGFKILLEVIVKGNLSKICEVPYTFGTRYRGKSKLSTKEVMNYLFHVLNLAPDYVRFAMVGAAGTVVNLGILALLRYALGVPHAYASAAAIEASVINNFILNDVWTFKSSKKAGALRRFIKFHLSSALGLLTQWIVSYVIYYVIFSQSIIAQLVGILAGFTVNYVLSKKFVWRS